MTKTNELIESFAKENSPLTRQNVGADGIRIPLKEASKMTYCELLGFVSEFAQNDFQPGEMGPQTTTVLQ
eukprot:4748602-Amphidinium_carterae.1